MNAIFEVLIKLLSFLQNNLLNIIVAVCAIIPVYFSCKQNRKRVKPKLKINIQNVTIEDEKGRRKGFIVFDFVNKGLSDIYIEHIKIEIKKNYYCNIEGHIESKTKVQDCEQTFPVCVTSNRKKSVAIPRPALKNQIE